MMDIEDIIEKGNKLNNDSIRYVRIQYDSLQFRFNLLFTASIFPFILLPFVELYIPVLFLNGAFLGALSILDYKTVEKQVDKNIIQCKKNINNLHDRYYQDAIENH